MTWTLWALATGVAMFCMDFVYAEYTKACADRKALLASLMASIMLGFGGFVVSMYVDDPWMLVPASIGAFFGTYVSVIRDKK